MRHVAAGDGSVSLLRAGHRHHRGILEIIVVTAVPEAVPVGLCGLETGTVQGAHFAVLVGHLGALHFDGQALADTAGNIIEQFGILVDVVLDDVIQVISGLVFHVVQILVAADGLNGGQGADLPPPKAQYNYAKCDQDADDPLQNLFHKPVCDAPLWARIDKFTNNSQKLRLIVSLKVGLDM